MTRELDAELVWDAAAALGEGPAWDVAADRLLWVDILAGEVHWLDPAQGQDDSLDLGTHVGAVVPHTQGGYVVAVRDGFGRLFPGGELTMIADTREPGVRMNDGICAPDGAFWAGTMAYDETPGAGTLYRLDIEGNSTPVLRDVTVSNGLAWSPDGSTAYYVDTPTQRVDAFRYDEGVLTDRRPFVRIDPSLGSPDGLTVDADGGVWVALWGGGAVHHYTPRGELAEALRLPAPRVTACTFGGPDLGDLYITTSRVDTDTDRYPEAGAVFRASLPVRGTPPLAYGS